MGEPAALGWRVHQSGNQQEGQEVLPQCESLYTSAAVVSLCASVQGLIEVLFLDEGELISTGVDGYVRVGVPPAGLL